MKKYTTVFFDLDGTIIDSGVGVADSVGYALEKLGITVDDKSSLRKFIGPPLVYSFRTFYGMDEETVSLAIEYYREHYSKKGIFEFYVYDGVRELLAALKNANIKIVVATSKPEDFAKQILAHEGIDVYFDYIAGATMDEKTRATKEDVIEYALKACNIDTASDVIMIGDRFYDIEGARRFGMDCIAVLYGYGSREEFENHRAKYIVETANEAQKLLLGK